MVWHAFVCPRFVLIFCVSSSEIYDVTFSTTADNDSLCMKMYCIRTYVDYVFLKLTTLMTIDLMHIIESKKNFFGYSQK